MIKKSDGGKKIYSFVKFDDEGLMVLRDKKGDEKEFVF